MHKILGEVQSGIRHNKLMIALFAVLMLTLPQMAFAQSTTIEFDPAPMFEQTNVWIANFLPVLAIGIGITIAIAVITFVGNEIKKAFN